jgi:GR25 family glycosyltransferase involved in LPS biosynthesis
MKFDNKNSFCISVLSNTVRWERMKERFAKLNMNVTRFTASTPNDIIAYKNQDFFAGHLNMGQKCCALSHFRLWEHILMSGLEYALVIEDDARFDNEWLQKINSLDLCDDWDAIFLNCSEPIFPEFTWKKVSEQYLTGGYVISKKGVANILGMFCRTLCASDWMTSRLQTLGKSYSYFPWLIIQDGSESTIGSDFNADHQKVLRCLGKINYSIDDHYT